MDLTKTLIKDTISFFKYRKDKATTEHQRWHNTSTTYGDSDLDASAVNFGREEAFEEAIDALGNILKNSK